MQVIRCSGDTTLFVGRHEEHLASNYSNLMLNISMKSPASDSVNVFDKGV